MREIDPNVQDNGQCDRAPITASLLRCAHGAGRMQTIALEPVQALKLKPWKVAFRANKLRDAPVPEIFGKIDFAIRPKGQRPDRYLNSKLHRLTHSDWSFVL